MPFQREGKPSYITLWSRCWPSGGGWGGGVDGDEEGSMTWFSWLIALEVFLAKPNLLSKPINSGLKTALAQQCERSTFSRVRRVLDVTGGGVATDKVDYKVATGSKYRALGDTPARVTCQPQLSRPTDSLTHNCSWNVFDPRTHRPQIDVNLYIFP